METKNFARIILITLFLLAGGSLVLADVNVTAVVQSNATINPPTSGIHISKMCQNLNFSDFGGIGTCFVQFALFGDIGLAGLMIMSVFVGFVVRYNMPGNLLLPLACALTYALFIISGGATLFLFLFILTLIINGVLVAIGMLNYINR